MTGFDTSSVELQVTGSGLREISLDGHEALGVLTGDVESLLGGAWTGAAAAQFRVGWDEWRAATVRVLQVLDALGEELGIAGREYEARELQSQDEITAAGGGL